MEIEIKDRPIGVGLLCGGENSRQVIVLTYTKSRNRLRESIMLKILAISQAWILVFMLLIGMINSLFLLMREVGRVVAFIIVFAEICFFAVSFDFYLAKFQMISLLSCGFHLGIGAWAFARAT
jgi:hypothetical protein